jgi:hypothetical protein
MPATLEIVVPLLSAERKPPVLFGNIGLPAGLLDPRKRSDCDNHVHKLPYLHCILRPWRGQRKDCGWTKGARLADELSPSPAGCTRRTAVHHAGRDECFNLKGRFCCRFAAEVAMVDWRHNYLLQPAGARTEPSNSGLPAAISATVALFGIKAYYHLWDVFYRSVSAWTSTAASAF